MMVMEAIYRGETVRPRAVRTARRNRASARRALSGFGESDRQAHQEFQFSGRRGLGPCGGGGSEADRRVRIRSARSPVRGHQVQPGCWRAAVRIVSSWSPAEASPAASISTGTSRNIFDAAALAAIGGSPRSVMPRVESFRERETFIRTARLQADGVHEGLYQQILSDKVCADGS